MNRWVITKSAHKVQQVNVQKHIQSIVLVFVGGLFLRSPPCFCSTGETADKPETAVSVWKHWIFLQRADNISAFINMTPQDILRKTRAQGVHGNQIKVLWAKTQWFPNRRQVFLCLNRTWPFIPGVWVASCHLILQTFLKNKNKKKKWRAWTVTLAVWKRQLVFFAQQITQRSGIAYWWVQHCAELFKGQFKNEKGFISPQRLRPGSSLTRHWPLLLQSASNKA